jgi:DNA-binding NarL/FixJ family response regulator
LLRDVAHRTLAELGVRIDVHGDECDDVRRQSSITLLVSPAPSHWESAQALRRPIVLLAAQPLDETATVEAVLRGADAICDSFDDGETIADAVATVATGSVVLSPEVFRLVLDAARQVPGQRSTVESLTPRELDILRSIDAGESVKQTARTLGISAKTVENLQSRLFRKLSVRNRAQAVSRSYQLGFLGRESNSNGGNDGAGRTPTD